MGRLIPHAIASDGQWRILMAGKKSISNKADNTAKKQLPEAMKEHSFKPGQSGNKNGRPKGARSKISESFLSDALEAWKTHGKTALAKMATEKPADFAKMIASIIPKEIDVQQNTASPELERLLRAGHDLEIANQNANRGQ